MELRDALKNILHDSDGGVLDTDDAVDAILAIPEIARWRSIAQSYDEARLGHDIRSE